MKLLALLFFAVAAAQGGYPAPPPDILGSQPATAYYSYVDRQLGNDRARLAPGPCATLQRQWLGRNRTGGNNVPADLLAASATHDVIIEHFRLQGCGRVSRHNILIYRQIRGGWMGVALLPGESLASPVLQRDTLNAAVRAAIQLSPTAPCRPNTSIEQRVSLGEIRMVSPPARPGGAWTERLAITYCGVDRSFSATFTPTPDGGADYSLRPLFATGPTGR